MYAVVLVTSKLSSCRLLRHEEVRHVLITLHVFIYYKNQTSKYKISINLIFTCFLYFQRRVISKWR